jgi:mono/diheme cytochrome c family protein|nr:c-type cytochrome [Kofleriaceae bacterium]
MDHSKLAIGGMAAIILGSLATAAFTAPAATAQAQIDQGKKLYTDKCATCHGAGGEGTKDGPPVVGKDAFPLDPRPKAKRDVKFHTAADVFAWASKHMPKDHPGTLTTDDYLAVFAFDLTANGITLDKPLDGAAAAKIVLHP